MTNETLQTDTTVKMPLPFGMRLQAAREAMRLERKDAAAQLRLSETVIAMMEKDSYPSDLPPTFIRGYMRSYGKLLDIPELEIKEAIEPIKPKPVPEDIAQAAKNTAPFTSSNYFMQFFTAIIVITMLGLVGMWWYSHSSTSASTTTDNQINNASNLIPITNPDAAINTQNAAQPISVLPPEKSANAVAAKTLTPASTSKTSAASKASTEEDASDDETDNTETNGDIAE